MSGEPVGRAVTVQIFPSQSMSLGFCLFIHSMRHFPEQSEYETPVTVIPLHPSPCRKGPIIAPPVTECPMITGSHECVHSGRVPNRPPTVGGRWRRKACLRVESGEGEKATSNERRLAAGQMSPGTLKARPGWKTSTSRASPRLRKRA